MVASRSSLLLAAAWGLVRPSSCFSTCRPLSQPPLSHAHRFARPLCSAPAPAESAAMDLVGDGGVLKTTVQPGEGSRPSRGATVEVHY